MQRASPKPVDDNTKPGGNAGFFYERHCSQIEDMETET